MAKKFYFEKAINWAKKKGLTSLKANFGEFDSPIQFNRKKDEESFTPDITGKKMGGKFYVEIAMKTDNMRRAISKWKLLDTMANLKKGKLFLLAPRGHKAFVERIIDKHSLVHSKVIYLR